MAWPTEECLGAAAVVTDKYPLSKANAMCYSNVDLRVAGISINSTTKYRRRFCPVIDIAAVVLVSVVLLFSYSHSAFGQTGDAVSRKGWQYTVAAGTRMIFDCGEQQWIGYTPKGPTFIYAETDRTKAYVELKDTRSGNSLRLFNDYAEFRKSMTSSWKRLAKGHWLKDPDPYAFDKFGPLDYRLRLVYFVPKDRVPKKDYETKIRVVMEIVADFFKQDLQSKKYNTEGLRFEVGDDGLPVVHRIDGELSASEYNDNGAFQTPRHHQRIATEINRQMLGDQNRRVVVVFAETYDEGPASLVWPGHIAQAFPLPPDGGNATFSAWMLKDEFCALTVEEQKKRFFDTTPVRGRRAIGHSGPDSPVFEFVEDSFGGVIHEVGHALGLPHDHRQAEVCIMGMGFRSLRWNLNPRLYRGRRVIFSRDNARILMCSRYLSSTVDRFDYKPPQVVFQLSTDRRGVAASLKISDDGKLKMVVLVDETTKERSIIFGKELDGQSDDFSVRLPASVIDSGEVKILALIVDGGGNITRISRGISKTQ